MAIWAFHGDADERVVPEGTTETVANLEACEGDELRPLEMTIYPGVGHNSWTRTYNSSAGHDIYAWLLTHRR